MQYNTPDQLKAFSRLPIEWNLDPADAVTLYLEWGNNDWRAEHPPVRSKDDFAHYFVLDNWTEHPTLRLVMRNSEAQFSTLPSITHPSAIREFFISDSKPNLTGPLSLILV